MEALLDKLEYWDYRLWFYLNTMWHNSFLDAFIPFLRNQWTWAPLYLFLAIFMPLNFKRKGIMWCIFFILTFALTDYISASILKQHFQRVRPCNNEYVGYLTHLLVNCGGGYSFPSSHAANHFGLGVFSAVTLQKKAKWIWPVAILWALSIAYAQVYVGVHFPFDVLVGGILGTLLGLLTGYVFNKVYNLNRPPKAVPVV